MSALLLASLVLAGGAVRLSGALASSPALTRLTAFLVLWAGGVNATCLSSGLLFGSFERRILLAVASALSLAMAVAGRPRNRHPPTTSTSGASRRAFRRVLAIFALVVAALAYGWQIEQAWRFPVLDWDGLAYHLVTVDVWLQQGAIVDVPQPQRVWSSAFPANGELMTLWLMAFTGNDDLADLTSAAYVPLLVAGTALLASSLGADRPAALIGGLLAALVPAAIVLGGTTYVDVPTAAASVAGLGLLITALDSSSSKSSDEP